MIPRSRLLPIEEHRKLAERLKVKLIMTPRDHFIVVCPDDKVCIAKERMELNHFDQLPVVEKSGQVIGLVRNDDIINIPPEKDVGEYVNKSVQNINAMQNISELLSLLESERCVWVVNKKGIVGLIHRSDLNREAVRTYFYLWLVASEMGLAEKVKGEYESDEKWIDFLSNQSQVQVLGNCALAKRGGMDMPPIGYADLSDLINVVTKDKDKEIWSKLGFTKKKNWTETTGKLVELRHKIMHPVRTLVSRDSDVKNLKRCDSCLRELVEALHKVGKTK